MLKELFLALIVALSVLLFLDVIVLIKYVAVLVGIYGIIGLLPLIPGKKKAVTTK